MGQELSPKAAMTAVVLILWVAGLVMLGVLDLYLEATGRLSLSERVWNGNAGLGLAVVAWAAVGAAFLVAHFWLGLLRP